MGYLIVFLGGGIGAALRHGANLLGARLFDPGFPYGTLIINVLGSLTMGVLAGYFAFRAEVPQHWRLFLTTGILGGFTTFSTFSLEVVLLWERHQPYAALLYVVLSVVIAATALALGLIAARGLL